MQQNLIKIPVIAQLDDKLWEGSSRDVSPRVVLQFPLNVTFFTSDIGTLCGMSKKSVSSCLHCFSVFVYLFGGTGQPACSWQTKPGKYSAQGTLCHVCSSRVDLLLCTCQSTMDYYQCIPLCTWFFAYTFPHLFVTSASSTSV